MYHSNNPIPTSKNTDLNKIPKIPTKDNSTVNELNISVKSVSPLPDKNTMPNTERILNKSIGEVKSEKKQSSQVKQNLTNKFDEVAQEDKDKVGIGNYNTSNNFKQVINPNENMQNVRVSSYASNDKPLTSQEELNVPNEERPQNINSEVKNLDPNLNQFNSNSKDKISVREGVDFTFKKSIVDTKSEMLSSVKKLSNSNYQSSPLYSNDILEYLNNREMFKQSVATVIPNSHDKKAPEEVKPVINSATYNSNSSTKNKLNKESVVNPDLNPNFNQEISNPASNPNIISNSVSQGNSKIVSVSPISVPTSNNSDKNQKPTPLNITEENVEDEFAANESDDVSSGNRSIISSNVLSHIHTPKMISGIKSSTEQSYMYSMYTKSENSRLDTQNNILMTDSNNTFIPHAHAEDTEFEITNENSDRFNKFIETPKSSNLFFSGSMARGNSQGQLNVPVYNYMNSMSTSNNQLKEANERLQKKEREAKRLNDKIQKIVNDLHKIEEENKRYERRIEKEESEGEMLRHMLNFLITNA